MFVTQWGMVGGMPGMKGLTFDTLKAAKAFAERAQS